MMSPTYRFWDDENKSAKHILEICGPLMLSRRKASADASSGIVAIYPKVCYNRLRKDIIGIP